MSREAPGSLPEWRPAARAHSRRSLAGSEFTHLPQPSLHQLQCPGPVLRMVPVGEALLSVCGVLSVLVRPPRWSWQVEAVVPILRELKLRAVNGGQNANLFSSLSWQEAALGPRLGCVLRSPETRRARRTQMTPSLPWNAAPSPLPSSPGGVEGRSLRDPQSAGLPRAREHGEPALLKAALPVAGAEPQPGAPRCRGLPVGWFPLPRPLPQGPMKAGGV